MTETGQHAWQRMAYGWYVAFGAIAALVLVLLLANDAPPGHRPAAVVALAVLVVVYAAVGARAVTGHSTALAVATSVASIVVVTIGVAAMPVFAVILFAVYPHLYAWLDDDLRLAVPAVVLLSVGVALGQISYDGWTLRSAAVAAASGGVSMVFALAFGLWISRIINQSAQRADMIAELRSTREQLAEVHHEAGVLKERQRLALEIHDTLAQGFTSLLMLTQAAEREMGTDDDAAREHLALAQRTARANLAEARSMVAALTPPALDGVPLREALRGVVDSFGEQTGLAARLTVAGTVAHLPNTVEVVLLRTVQEALNNVRRHSGAKSVDVRLSYVDGHGTASVTDDGVGFDPEVAAGFGLRGMRSRVEEAGGAVRVRSTPGLGTSVTVSVP